MGIKTGDTVAYAFAMVIGAGLSTTLGATFAFCADVANKTMLAVSLGLSAGVMIYVSFGEIFMVKSMDAFKEHLCSEEMQDADECPENYEDKALQYATFSFFGGILITYGLDMFVHLIMHHLPGKGKSATCGTAAQPTQKDTEFRTPKIKSLEEGANAEDRQPPSNDSNNLHDYSTEDGKEVVPIIDDIFKIDHHAFMLQKASLLSGLAIALHNFPEGLATYVAAIADPASGMAIAVAIALHNIPEGIVVAMPIYYSTGSRMKAFIWAFLSGVSEPIGGVFGWIILSNMGLLTYAIMFSLVAGMMIYISMSELIPSALAFDTQNKYVTKSIIVGMGIMAASLLMFTL